MTRSANKLVRCGVAPAMERLGISALMILGSAGYACGGSTPTHGVGMVDAASIEGTSGKSAGAGGTAFVSSSAGASETGGQISNAGRSGEAFCPVSESQPDGPEVVPGSLSGDLNLELLPDGVSTFNYVGCQACSPLDAIVLIRNSGANTNQLDRLSIEPIESGFEVSSMTTLPAKLDPGRSLALKVLFRGKANVQGTLRVHSGTASSAFQVNGNAVTSDRLTARNVYAWDFGDVLAGTTSAPLEVLVQHQRADAQKPPVEGGKPNVARPFEVLGAQQLGQLRSCDQRRITVVFHAPQDTGAFEGVLLYELTTTTASALHPVYLFGRSVAAK